MGRSRAPYLHVSTGVYVVGGLALLTVPRAWPWIAGIVAANHLTLVGAGLWPKSTLVGPNLRRVRGLTQAVVLTFDDGPDPDVTPRVLDCLDAHEARATFFCIGRHAERHPDLIGEIARRGHGVENHTYRHSNAFSLFGSRAMAREIDRAQQTLARACGTRPRYFRAPAGLRSPWLDPLLAARGLDLVSWTRRGFDKVARDPGKIAERLLRGVAPGDILLLHDGAPARDTCGRPVVLEALPRVLDGLAERGLRATALPRSRSA